jgi:uncharacterized membrane protein YkvA (DUF1232 family)
MSKYEDLLNNYSKGKKVNESDKTSFFDKAGHFLNPKTLKTLWHIATHPNCALECFDYGDYAILIAVVAYVIMPLDAIPDIIPIIGLTDDAALVAWALSNFADALRRYEEICM